MNKIICIFAAVGALFLVHPHEAQAAMGGPYGYVCVSTYTYTAMASTTSLSGALGQSITNDSTTDAIRCGFDVNVSTIAGNANLGYKIDKGVNAFAAIRNTIYCKSESATACTPTTVVVLKN